MTEESKQPARQRQNDVFQNDVFMEAEIIDQLNTNQQSNMTLSTESVITQTESMLKLNLT
ncbi:MAG TPA: hypothetical protein VFC74_10875 [Oscillospiraceae bacterium]|nr:hypothetical protein [Oscillospiraceae bacterium]